MIRAVFLLTVFVIGFARILQADSGCPQLTTGAARGVMCLHCLYPPAIPGVDKLTDALLKSCRREVAISFVTDGSWGFSADVIKSQVAKFANTGRRLHLHLYVVNGPAQRRFNKGMFSGWSIIDPFIFRREIAKRNSTLQKRYKAEVKKLVPIIRDAIKQGAKVTLSPALEDNFTNGSFDTALRIMKNVVPRNLPVRYVRNSCGACYLGNESHVPRGVLTEFHPPLPSYSLRDGLVANDGFFFIFRSGISSASGGEALPERTFSFADMQTHIRYASGRNNSYFLWIGKYQGSKLFLDLTPPDQRYYAIPADDEVKDITELLKS